MKKIAYLIVGFLFLTACEKSFDYYGGYPDSKLVLFAFVKPDSVIRAEIKRTRFFADTMAYKDFKAGGSIYVNGDFAGELIAEENRYVSTVCPKAGDHVLVKVSADGFEDARGEIILPLDAPEIAVDTFCTRDASKGDRLNFKIMIQDPGKGRRYYRLIIERRVTTWVKDEIIYAYSDYSFKTDKDPLLEGGTSLWFDEDDPNKYKIFTNEIFEGKTYVMKVSADMDHSFESRDEQDGEVVVQRTIVQYRVRVVNIDKGTYLYLKSVQMAERGDGFMEPIQVYSNVSNGVGVVGYACEALVVFQMPEKDRGRFGY